MTSVCAGGGDPLPGASGPGSLAGGAAGLRAAASVEREEECLEASLGHACAQKAVIRTREMHCAVIQSPALSVGSVQNIKQLGNLFLKLFFPLEAGAC